MATVLPHGLSVIVGASARAHPRCLRGEVEYDLRPESEVVMPSTRRNGLIKQTEGLWSVEASSVQTMSGNYAGQVYLE
jgi:hypothetical protein